MMEPLGIGKRLRDIRGYETITSFAQQIGIHKSTLVRYEKETGFPDAKTLVLICKTFNINPTWLLLGEGQKEVQAPPLTHSAAHNALRERLRKSSIYGFIHHVEGLSVDNYRAYLRGEYFPTKKELDIICKLANWDFETGQMASKADILEPTTLKHSDQKITDIDCIFHLIKEAMAETSLGMDIGTMEVLSKEIKGMWSELKSKVKSIIISSTKKHNG